MTDVRCPHCEKTFTLDEPAPTVPRLAGDMTCPKCGDAQPSAAACRRCGLLAERMADFAREQDSAAPELVAAWEALEAKWDDAAAHDRFLELVASVTAWPWAARRYRARLREHPDDARATEQLARVARMTEAMLRASATARPKESYAYRRTIALVGLLLVLLMIGFAYAFIVKGVRSTQDEQEAPHLPKPRTPPHLRN